MIGGVQAGWDEVQGIERESEYIDISKARLKHWGNQQGQGTSQESNDVTTTQTI